MIVEKGKVQDGSKEHDKNVTIGRANEHMLKERVLLYSIHKNPKLARAKRQHKNYKKKLDKIKSISLSRG